ATASFAAPRSTCRAVSAKSGIRYEGRHFDLDLGPLVDQAIDVKQRRGREVTPERLLPGRANAGSCRLIVAAAGEIPGQADNMLRTSAGLAEQLHDPLERGCDLRRQVGGIVALLIAAGLARQHNPAAGAAQFDAM